MTETRKYRILEQAASIVEEKVDDAGGYLDRGIVTAASVSAAIAAHAAKLGKDALGKTFVAIPERSWNPATLKPRQPSLPFTIEHEKPPTPRGAA